jgi:hypothetical protein
MPKPFDTPDTLGAGWGAMVESNSIGLSRRALLRSGLAGLGLVALSGGAIALRGTKLRAMPPGGLRVLSLAEYSILAAIADRMCPAKAPGVPGASDLDVAFLADRMLENALPDAQQGVKLATRIVENGLTGALFFERVTPFTQLAPAEQDRALRAFKHSKVAVRRTLFRALSGLTGAMYYGHPDTWPSVGYPGPPDHVAMREAYRDQLVDFDALRARPAERG